MFNIPRFAQISALFQIYPIVAATFTCGPAWSGHTVLFFSDNSATAEIINKGRSRSLLIMSFMRRLMWLSLMYTFHFPGQYISGDNNVAADALSRLDFSHFLLQHPEADPVGKPVPLYSLLIMDKTHSGHKLPNWRILRYLGILTKLTIRLGSVLVEL